jgi:hypothetical protein
MQRLAAAALTSILFAAPATGSTFDAAADFSPTQNPNGAWSYGYTTTLGGLLHLYTQHGPDNVDPPNAQLLDTWNAGTSGVFRNPAVFHNGTPNPVSFSLVTYAPGELGFHPGQTGQYSVVRFTAPSTASFALDAIFSALDSVATTDVHVLRGGVSIFDGFVEPATVAFSSTVHLNAGQTLDFVVGRGHNGTFSHDSTGLDAVLRTVEAPEPGTSALVGAGLLALRLAGRGRARR